MTLAIIFSLAFGAVLIYLQSFLLDHAIDSLKCYIREQIQKVLDEVKKPLAESSNTAQESQHESETTYHRRKA